jgi:hypothetical protein
MIKIFSRVTHLDLINRFAGLFATNSKWPLNLIPGLTPAPIVTTRAKNFSSEEEITSFQPHQADYTTYKQESVSSCI